MKNTKQKLLEEDFKNYIGYMKRNFDRNLSEFYNQVESLKELTDQDRIYPTVFLSLARDLEKLSIDYERLDAVGNIGYMADYHLKTSIMPEGDK